MCVITQISSWSFCISAGWKYWWNQVKTPTNLTWLIEKEYNVTIKTKLLCNTLCETRQIQRKTTWHRQETYLKHIVIICRKKEIWHTCDIQHQRGIYEKCMLGVICQYSVKKTNTEYKQSMSVITLISFQSFVFSAGWKYWHHHSDPPSPSPKRNELIQE